LTENSTKTLVRVPSYIASSTFLNSFCILIWVYWVIAKLSEEIINILLIKSAGEHLEFTCYENFRIKNQLIINFSKSFKNTIELYHQYKLFLIRANSFKFWYKLFFSLSLLHLLWDLKYYLSYLCWNGEILKIECRIYGKWIMLLSSSLVNGICTFESCRIYKSTLKTTIVWVILIELAADIIKVTIIFISFLLGQC